MKMPEDDESKQSRIYVTSHHQQGGITAGVVNISGVVPAAAEFSTAEHEEAPEGFLTRIEMRLLAQYTIPTLQAVAFSPTLKGMNMEPASGQNIFDITEGTATLSDGEPVRFWRVRNAGGKYRIETITECDEIVNLQISQPLS